MESKGIWGEAAPDEEPLKGEAVSPLHVTVQATDDKAKMASADSGCSSAPLFHGPQMGWEGGVIHVCVCMCVYMCVASVLCECV